MIFSSAKKAFFLHSIKVSPNTCPKNTERTPTMRKIHCKRTFRLVFRIKNLEIFNRTSLKVPLELQFIENTTCFISLSNTCFFPPLSVCSVHYSTGHRKNQPQTTTFSNKYRKSFGKYLLPSFHTTLHTVYPQDSRWDYRSGQTRSIFTGLKSILLKIREIVTKY